LAKVAVKTLCGALAYSVWHMAERTIFYDRFGVAIAYTNDGERIYLFDGRPAAFIRNGSVYAYSGQHLGWLSDGWIRDHNGDAVYFSNGPRRGGPVPPVPHVPPVPAVPQVPPVPGVPQVRPVSPVPSLGWSQLAAATFFERG
jgi:hypothetical protein